MANQENSPIALEFVPIRLGLRLAAALAASLALAYCTLPCRAQETAPDAAPGLASNPHADPRIAEAIRHVSADHVRATIEKLVSFNNRSTISAQDDESIKAGKGIGAAREWIKGEFERYSKDCGGCLEVKTDAFTEQPADRIPKATEITNVYAVLRGSDPKQADRIVLVTGHYDSRNSDTFNVTDAAPGANDDGSGTVSGEIGFGEHTTITAFGDALSVSARLQDLTKELGCEALVSETVMRTGEIEAAELPAHTAVLRGFEQPVAVRMILKIAGAPPDVLM